MTFDMTNTAWGFFCKLPLQIQPYLFICIKYSRCCHKSYRILKHVSHAVTSHSRYLSSNVYSMTFGSSADKPGDLRAPLMQQQQWCYVHTGLYYTAGWLHRIPFAIWHRHVVLACDRCCTALVPEVTNDLLDCLFFSVTKNYLFDDGHQCNPRHPDGPGGCCCLSSEITFTSNELCLCVRERGWVSECVCLCACMWKDVHVDVHVQEDASLPTHSLLDAFN